MPQTGTYGLPYAGPNDPPNGAAQQEALAEATDTALGNIDTEQTNQDGRLDTLESNGAVGVWQTLSLVSGYSARNGLTPQVRVFGNQVWLRGQVQRTDGTGIPEFTSFATLPADAAPLQEVNATAAMDHSSTRTYTASRLILGRLNGDSVEIADQDPNGEPLWLSLDGVVYWTD